MSDPWIFGYLSTPLETKVERNNRRNIFSTEALNTLLKLWDIPAGDISKDIQKAYDEACLYAEHTFGMDTGKICGQAALRRRIYQQKERRNCERLNHGEES